MTENSTSVTWHPRRLITLMQCSACSQRIQAVGHMVPPRNKIFVHPFCWCQPHGELRVVHGVNFTTK